MNLQDQIKIRAHEKLMLANDILKSLGKPEIPYPEFEFGCRVSRKTGQAKARIRRTDKGIVLTQTSLFFNTFIAETNQETVLNVTVPHEVAHLMSFVLGETGHGHLWKSCCKQIGLANPKRGSAVKLRGYVEYTCRCGQTHYITPKTSVKIENKTCALVCKLCEGDIFKKPIDKVA